MDIVLDSLKCVDCRKTLDQPISLPCGHLICKSHTEEIAQEEIICSKCGTRHQNKEFAVIEAVLNMIKVQLDSFDFGPEHSETTKSCDELKNEIDKNDSILNDMDYFIHKSVDSLKNRVLLQSEHLKAGKHRSNHAGDNR